VVVLLIIFVDIKLMVKSLILNKFHILCKNERDLRRGGVRDWADRVHPFGLALAGR
jgi:hypothetical protein